MTAANFDHIRIYTNMMETLEQLADAEKLGELFLCLRSSGESRSLPLDDDDDILRMLARMGVVDASSPKSSCIKIAEEFLRDTARTVSRTPAMVSIVFRLYSSGMYGVMPKAVCSSNPVCSKCKITKDCDYYNSPKQHLTEQRVSPMLRVERDQWGSLTDEELIAFVLGGSRVTQKHKDEAAELVKCFGSLRSIARSTYREMSGLRNVGQASAVRVSAAAAFMHRVLEEKRAQTPLIRTSKDFYDLYHHELRDKKKENFIVIMLDQKSRILRDDHVSVGTLTSSLVHPREVLGPAMRESAASVAFVHNHPSGDSTPSPEDINITKRLQEVAETMGIRVLDHIIVGDGVYTSFLDEGLL